MYLDVFQSIHSSIHDINIWNLITMGRGLFDCPTVSTQWIAR